MNIYLFSEHTPDPEMLQELGGAITAQFQGTISDIHRRGEQITFTEVLIMPNLEGKEVRLGWAETALLRSLLPEP